MMMEGTDADPLLQGSSHVISMQPELSPQSENDINIIGAIPPALEAQMLKMVQEMKDKGDIASDVNDYELMLSMHRQMMKEREAVMNMASGQPVPSAAAFNPNSAQAGHAHSSAGHGHSHGGKPCSGHPGADTHEELGENLLKSVTTLLQTNPGAINNGDKDGDTLLHRVSKAGNGKLAQLLISRGADTNSLNNLGVTPIMTAASTGQILIIQLLLDNGGSVSSSDNNGWTALHHAASGSAALCPQTLHYLTECCGMSYATLTSDGKSLLHIIANTKKDNNREMLKLLLKESELNPQWVDNDGCNAMHYAVQTCQPNVCYKFACAAGSQLLIVPNKHGKTALDIAEHLPSLVGFNMYQEMESWIQKGRDYRPSNSRPTEFYKHLLAPGLVFIIIGIVTELISNKEGRHNSFGYLYLLAVLCLFVMVMKPPARIDHMSKLQSPAKAGGFAFSALMMVYTITIGTYGFCYLDLYDRGQQLLLALLYLSIIICSYLYYKLVTHDPGYTYESKRKESGVYYTMRDLVTTFKKPGIWCPVCQLIPTKPSKHCKQCERCVYWMDHHCLYTMNCVGHKNHHTFVLFNLCLVVIQILYICRLPGYIATLDYYDPWIRERTSFIDKLIYIFFHDGMVMVTFMGNLGFLVGFSLPLTTQSLYNVANGYTAYFKPGKDKESGLTTRQKIVNALNFIRTGKIKEHDPNYKI